MAQNAWSQLQIDPNTAQYMAAMGQKALASGKVSPMEAMQNLKEAMGGGGQNLPGMAAPAAYQASGDSGISMANPPSGSAVDMSSLQPQERVRAEVSNAPKEKGDKEIAQEQNNRTVKRSSTIALDKPQDLYKRELLQAQGIYPKQKLDSSGQPAYEMARDENGSLLTDSEGHLLNIPDQSKPIFDMNDTETDPNHPVQRQLAALDQMQNMLAMQSGANERKNLVDLRPLMKLADYESARHGTPTNSAEGYQAPQSGTGAITADSMALLKNKAEVNKEILDNAKLQSGGKIQDQLMQALLNKNVAERGLSGTAGNMEDRMDRMDHRQILNNIDKNSPLAKGYASLTQIKNGLSLLGSGQLNAQALKEAQVIIRTAIQSGSGSRTGVDERASTYMNNIGMDVDVVKQFLNSDVEKMSPNDPIVKHFVSLSKTVGSKIAQQENGLLNALSEGHASMYERRPDLKGDLDKKVGAYASMYTVPSTPQGPKTKQAPSGTAPRAAPVSRKKSLDQMSKAELDAYEASLTKGH